MSRKLLHKLLSTSLWVLVFSTYPLQAQKQLNLQQCFEYADANNVQLRQLKMNEALRSIDVQQGNDNLLPTVNGNMGLNYGLTSTRDFETNNIFITRSSFFSYGVSANQSIFEGFSRLYAIKNAELNLDVAQLETQIFRNNLQLAIFSTYLEIVRAKEQIKIIEKQNQQLTEQINRTKKLISSGVLPKGDLIELQSQEAQQEASLVNAENALALAKLNLQQQILLNEDFTLIKPNNLKVPTLEAFEQYSVNTIYENAIGYRPEIEANKMRLSIAEYNIKTVDARKLPTLSLNSNLGTSSRTIRQPDSVSFFNTFSVSQSNIFRQFAENFNFGIGVNAIIPIFNRWTIRNGKKTAEIALETQKLSAESTEIELYNAIQQAYLSAKTSALNYKASTVALENARKALDIIQKKYDYGSATSLELSTALNNVAFSELNNNNARFSYLFAVKILDFYNGENLELE